MLAPMRFHLRRRTFFAIAVLSYVVVACVTQERRLTPRNGWWAGQGPVLPHDSFPANCKLCHEGDDWQTLVVGFQFKFGLIHFFCQNQHMLGLLRGLAELAARHGHAPHSPQGREFAILVV